MHYISLMTLTQQDRLALRITDAYRLHQAVYAAHEDLRSKQDKQDGKSSGFLWVDKGIKDGLQRVLMLSNRLPSAHIQQEFGHITSKPLPDGFLTHAQYRFETVVAPMKRVRNRARAIHDEAKIVQWFLDNASQKWGFEVAPHAVSLEQTQQIYINGKHKTFVKQAKLSGVLTVTDPAVFANSFYNGIGRQKTFGCGLLQITPIL